jgi:hypothetical protein
MGCRQVKYSGHAVRRMFERRISQTEVVRVLRDGEVIADYPDDRPYPSALMFAVVEGRPLHVVVARDREDDTCVVITVYVPDTRLWGPDFRTRRRS